MIDNIKHFITKQGCSEIIVNQNKVVGLFRNNIIIVILLIGIACRLYQVGVIPGNSNLNQDEAFAAYEAFSLAEYGMDSHGYHNPVYLVAWGSGMNALETYCMIPFIKLFGLNSFALRLPQLILGCITLIFVYLLINQCSNNKIARWAIFILAICPWHIMLCRWGLESNFIVGMLTIAIYFLISAGKSRWKIILAGIFMGLVLYCYAAAWMVLPIIVIGLLIYLYIDGSIDAIGIFCYLISLLLVALPILTFVAVNMGFVNEIKLSLISIPKLSYFRNGDVSFSLERLAASIKLLWEQNDGLVWNSTDRYGLFYKFSNLFIILGFIKSVIRPAKKDIPIWIWFASAIILCSIVEANVNRINIIFIPIVYFLSVGINTFITLISKMTKKSWIVLVGVVALYLFSLSRFMAYYVTDYDSMMEKVWYDGAGEAINAAVKKDCAIHIQYGDMLYPLVLFYSQYPADRFVNSVVYENEEAAFLAPLSFDGYTIEQFGNATPLLGDVYICSVNNSSAMDFINNNNMNYDQYGDYVVAFVGD